MIKLHVVYRTKAGMRDAFYHEIEQRGFPAAFRSERGNFLYSYTFPEHDPSVLVLDEQWSDEESLDAHRATDLFREYNALKEEYVLKTDIERS